MYTLVSRLHQHTPRCISEWSTEASEDKSVRKHFCVCIWAISFSHKQPRGKACTQLPRRNSSEAALLNPSNPRAQWDFLGTSPMNESPMALFFLKLGVLLHFQMDWVIFRHTLSFRVNTVCSYESNRGLLIWRKLKAYAPCIDAESTKWCIKITRMQEIKWQDLLAEDPQTPCFICGPPPSVGKQKENYTLD